jgi:hypothetical protein
VPDFVRGFPFHEPQQHLESNEIDKYHPLGKGMTTEEFHIKMNSRMPTEHLDPGKEMVFVFWRSN